MCNIAGYVGTKQAAPVIIEMLRKQESWDAGFYTGIATLHDGTHSIHKVVGSTKELLEQIPAMQMPGTVGIIHGRSRGSQDARWAHPFVGTGEKLIYCANANGIAFSDGEKSAVILVVDGLGLYGACGYNWPGMIEEALGLDKGSVILCSTHTHTAPGVYYNKDYDNWEFRRLCDTATLALQDLKPVTDVQWTEDRAVGMTFPRRFKLNDGTVMTKPSARALFANSSHEVATHGYNHLQMTRLDGPDMIDQIARDRQQLEADFDRVIRGFAYPFGAFNEDAVAVLKMCGIVYARTTRSTHSFGLPENWLKLHPTCHHNDPALMDLAHRFLEMPYGQMFYLWGHSYEFDDRDNWNVIEEFAAFIANREDVWYATNMEIYNYVQAYRALVTNYEKTVVHNPTITTLWFEQNDKTYTVKPGETLHI